MTHCRIIKFQKGPSLKVSSNFYHVATIKQCILFVCSLREHLVTNVVRTGKET